MGPLILIRHGQSLWNEENRFTGWVNVDLTDKGREEARKAGLILRYSGLDFTHSEVFVSPLKRAKETCAIVLAYLSLSLEPRDDINFVERYYGALTGCRKEEVVKVYGRDQV